MAGKVQNGANIVKDFNDAYGNGYAAWSTAWTEMKKDIAYVLGNQWDVNDERYLAAQGRAALKFNKMMKCVKLVSGYQRKNRLSLKADPVEGSDELTANQLTACILWLMSANQMYQPLSDAFESGPLMTGINLIQVGMDFSTDLANGDPQLFRFPYNQFILDPSFTRPDLSDCDFAIVRQNVTKNKAKGLLPFMDAKDIDALLPKGGDSKFPLMSATKDSYGRPKLRLDYFWQRTSKPMTMILDRQTGQTQEIDIAPDQIQTMMEVSRMQYGDRLHVLQRTKSVVELNIILENECVFKGPDSSGIEDGYPLVPIIGTYVPEFDDWRYKIQGMARPLRDPQTEKNKRMSQMIDIQESQIQSGWIVKEGAVVNTEALYKAGQGKVIFRAESSDITDVAQQKATEVPASQFQLQEILDREIPDIAGINGEMFGAPENDNLQVAGVLAKMRQAAGLVNLQGYFDSYRFSKQLVGRKLIECIQKNWTPQKVARVTGQQPSPAFYTKQFGKYDAAVTEGLLTDSQRQMFYAELKALRQDGYAIPVSVMIEYCPIQMKEELKKALLGAEQAQGEAAKKQQELDEITKQAMQAQIILSNAQAREKLTGAEENRATALLNQMKAVAETQDIGAQRAIQVLQILLDAEIKRRGLSQAQGEAA